MLALTRAARSSWVCRPRAATLSHNAKPQQHTQRTRELILSVLSTVPSPREARKFLDSVSGRETLRSQREFAEQQAQEASETPGGGSGGVGVGGVGDLVPGEFLHHHHTSSTNALSSSSSSSSLAQEKMRRGRKTLAALVCVDSSGTEPRAKDVVGKLLAQMQRIGVAPIVLVAADTSDGHHAGVVEWTHALADAVEREGGSARPICEGVFCCSSSDDAEGASVVSEPITAAIAQGRIPVIAPLVADSALRLRVLDARATAVPGIARVLASLDETSDIGSMTVARLILLSSASGIASANGDLYRLVNLEEDYTRLAAATSCAETRELLKLMRTCLGVLSPTAAGIVASVYADPSLVLKGLISERPITATAGKKKKESNRRRLGLESTTTTDYEEEERRTPNHQFTLLRHGFRIQRHMSLDTCDLDRLRVLLE
ncbi:Amino-acid acetyltransferase, mitochondrial, partial [Coemansia sp. RSA 1836]